MQTVVQVVFGRVKLGKKNGGHSRTYSYLADGLGLIRVGDQVVVPDNWAHPFEQLATVVGFGRGDYEGPLAKLSGIVRRPKDSPGDTHEPLVSKADIDEAFANIWMSRIARAREAEIAASRPSADDSIASIDGLFRRVRRLERLAADRW